MYGLQAQDAAGDAAGSAKSATGDVSGSAKSAGGDVASSAKSAAGDAKGAAQSAGRQIDQATPDLSGVFDGILDKVSPQASVFLKNFGGDSRFSKPWIWLDLFSTSAYWNAYLPPVLIFCI